jgi:hypothetical protein
MLSSLYSGITPEPAARIRTGIKHCSINCLAKPASIAGRHDIMNNVHLIYNTSLNTVQYIFQGTEYGKA